MHILIVGAGLGGLAAACCFAQDGHHVQVFEQRASLSSKGSGLMIRPGASRILQSWGLGNAIEKVADICPPFSIRDLKTGKGKARPLPILQTEYPDWGIHRPVLQDILYERAIQAGAEIFFESVVERFQDELNQTPVLYFKGGSVVTGDLILIADGIRSRLRAQVLADVSPGRDIEPRINDFVFYGVKLSKEELESNADAKELSNQIVPHVWVSKDRFVVGRKPGKLDLWSGLFGLKHDDGQANMWNEDGDIKFVRSQFQDSCPSLSAVLQIATMCDRWKIAEMPDLPRWTSKNGRAILLGDSAHAMEPNAAQGLSQIIEDIGVLQTLLSTAPNLPILMISRFWEDIRKPRVERIKAYAAWNTRRFAGKRADAPVSKYTDSDWKAINEIQADSTGDFTSPAFFKWAHDFDVIEQTHQYLKQVERQTKRSKL